MSDYITEDYWYALFVVTGEEDNVKERLIYRFGNKLRVIVPKRRIRERKDGRWSENIRLLFPGYVLLNGYIGIEEHSQLKGIPGMIKLLSAGHEPLRIQNHEIEALKLLVAQDETIGPSRIFVENDKITVVDGPLMSLEGQIVSVNKRKGRAKVRLSFLGEEKTVELSVQVLGYKE